MKQKRQTGKTPRKPQQIVAPEPLPWNDAPTSVLPQGEVETDPAVLKHLEWFKHQKFGLMLHWGPYSQWGVVESWSLCSEDEPWCQRSMDNYVEYCRQYEDLQKTFNPAAFDPDAWAAKAHDAGMRYLVFTTKHHDGFCMFDTKQTTYRTTHELCAFHSHPRANIARELFRSFRKKGFGIGVYFSKPDWHSPWYWSPYWAHPDRHVNYDVTKHPDLWEKFRLFTFKQLEELMTGYGPVDILWFDGGWVRPDIRHQDIHMDAIAAMARSHHPGIIMVDRTVTGRFENYRTPEQEVPEKPLPYPWETCMTMGNSWSYVPNDVYKPAINLIHLLIEIVAKGGNFLLNIGPDPLGNLPPESLKRLEEIGTWIRINGDAIYKTRPVAPYKEGKICFTCSSAGAVNAIYVAGEKESEVPSSIWLQSIAPSPGSSVRMLGVNKTLAWEKNGNGSLLHVPPEICKNPPCKYAWAFVVEKPILQS